MARTAGRPTRKRARRAGPICRPNVRAMVAIRSSQGSTLSKAALDVRSSSSAPPRPPRRGAIIVGRSGTPQTPPMPRRYTQALAIPAG